MRVKDQLSGFSLLKRENIASRIKRNKLLFGLAVDRMEKTVPCLIDDMGAVLTDDEVGDIADLINAPCFFVLERCQIGIGSLA